MYGLATDTPGHLQALRSSNEASIHDAINHLSSAIVHQETVSPAAPYVAQVLLTALCTGEITHESARTKTIEWFSYLAQCVQQVEIPSRDSVEEPDQDLLDELATLDGDAADEFLECNGVVLYEQTFPFGYIQCAELAPTFAAKLATLPDATATAQAWRNI